MTGFCTFQSTIHEEIKLSILTNFEIRGLFGSCYTLYWIDGSDQGTESKAKEELGHVAASSSEIGGE